VDYLLHAVDTLGWLTPSPAPERVVDLVWYGARIPETHEALVETARRHNLFYVFDTVRPGRPYDLAVHRQALVNLSHRAKLLFVNPAKAAVPEHRGDQLGEIGYRYVEVAAAGTPMVGGEPTTPAWGEFFNWPDACIDIPVGSADVESTVMGLLGDEKRLERIGRRNQVGALRGLDIAYRWKAILDDFGFEYPPQLQERIETLNKHADAISPVSPSPVGHAEASV